MLFNKKQIKFVPLHQIRENDLNKIRPLMRRYNGLFDTSIISEVRVDGLEKAVRHDESAIGEMSLNEHNLNKTFVTTNRSLEYNIDEVYCNHFNMTAGNRTVINKSEVTISAFIKIREIILDKYIEVLKTSKIINLAEKQEFSYDQHVGTVKGLTNVLMDCTLDSYKCLQIFILHQGMSEELQQVITEISDLILLHCPKKVVKNPERTFNMIANSSEGLYLVDVQTAPPNDESETFIDHNYNDNFKEFDELVLDSFENNINGLILLHGVPGTGKTNYIRHLITQNSVLKQKYDEYDEDEDEDDEDSGVTHRKMIYIPPDMAHTISSPNFITFMLENKNSIIVIEDAERILQKREGGGGEAVANLLNITDGLLGDCLKFTIICTFNCPEESIDEALLRGGRLIGKYRFEKLKSHKAKALTEKMNLDNVYKGEDMTLAEIYKHQKHNFKHVKAKDKTGPGFY